MDRKTRQSEALSRRSFMQLAGLGAGAAGVAATGLAARPAPAKAAPESKTAVGYRETEHVKTYYALARM